MGADNSRESKITGTEITYSELSYPEPGYIFGCNGSIPRLIPELIPESPPELIPQYIPSKGTELKPKLESQIDPLFKLVEPSGFTFKYQSGCLLMDNRCCICHEKYKPEDMLHMLPCNHVFNRKCILEWYQKSETCPICHVPKPKFKPKSLI